jgi:hypothetical protein
MKITSDLFHAHLKCSAKCWLRATNEPATENDYPKWVKAQNYSYRAAEVARLAVASGLRGCLCQKPTLARRICRPLRIFGSIRPLLPQPHMQLDSRLLEAMDYCSPALRMPSMNFASGLVVYGTFFSIHAIERPGCISFRRESAS